MQKTGIEYIAAETIMEGYYARIDTGKAQPLVLLVHDWSGNREFIQERARYFAEQGFVGFAVDMYGKGKRGSDTDKELNQQLLGDLLEDRSAVVTRLQAALDCALGIGNIDSSKIMTIGFCMGGLCALDFARSGADITGVVSVHGILTAPEPNYSNKITAKVLALHGHEDKMVRPENVLEFETEMTERSVDWQMHTFGNTFHAFTNPKADDPDIGLKYSAINDKRTWALVKNFTDEIF